ncbi:Fic family protein [Arcicella aurantiaca]|uniref:Fic family protein n=1 Tax=Arcicella aurantiaca TaxID=591202 RepID=A0A316EHI0_9BACT|nr:Fic family protein [Arcicella aurantiaca]PWK28945.1 Fic family protein [Arcicella aurantiaca]
MNYQIPMLPLGNDVETKAVLKQAAKAHRRLAELKGVALTIPNEQILISTLTLQEAKDSSAIENIVTTHDEIFKAELYIENLRSPAAKEVQSYANALRKGFGLVRQNKILSNNYILQIQEELEQNKAGFRKLPGTALKNQQTGETVYTPPQDSEDILRLMQNLEAFINNDDLSDLDPLVKLAIIHHQFESIHPFYDGNGRTGRIINILYLVSKDLLDIPVLYLSRYVIENKGEYYRLLQLVRDKNQWEDWLIFMLTGIEQTAIQTIKLIENIKELMMDYKKRIRSQFPKIYSQELLNSLFSHPYTKIEFVEESLRITRKTASSYLKELVEANYLELIKIGRSNFYLNKPLFDLFLNVPDLYKADTPIIESGRIG